MRYLYTIILSFIFTSSFAQTPSVKWSYLLKDVSFGQTTAKDVDGDGKLELIFSTYWNDSNVYCLNAEDGSLKWKHAQPGPAGGCNDAGPLIFDPFNDGNYKVVIPGSCMDTTFCVDADSGYVQWKTITGGGDSPPSTADVDNDGIPDVLHGTFEGNIQCLNGQTGAIKWTLPVDANAAIESEATIIDNAGELDFIGATYDFTADSNRINCYKASTHTLKWSHYTNDLIYHGPATGDIDRDGRKEVVVGDYSGNLYCLKADDGSLVWQDSVSKAGGGYIGAPVTLADLNNDGYLDVIYMDGNMVRVVDHNDVTEWSYTPPGDYTSFRGAVVADVNGDSIKDVTFATYYGQVISLDGVTGALIRSFDVANYCRTTLGDTSSIFEIDNAPIIADFDGDGILDLFIVGGKGRSDSTSYTDNGYAVCLSWGTGNGPDWTMFRHDQRRTACLCDSMGLPATTDVQELNTQTAAANIFPNPASTAFAISLYLPRPTTLSICLTDIAGKTIIAPVTKNYIAGNNTFSFTEQQTTVLANGVYFVMIRGDEMNLAKRVVVEK